MRMIARALLFSVVLLAFPTGLAFAHAIQCYTAFGYTVTCQPKPHDNQDLYGTVIFGFKTGATYTQTQYGSFIWERVRITDGYEIQPARFGDTYIWQNSPFQQLVYSTHWFCVPVSWILDDTIEMYEINNSVGGTWLQYSTPAASTMDCYSPTPYQDALQVNAF